jgi:hypothetical protein
VRLAVVPDTAWRVALASLCAASAGCLCFWALSMAGYAVHRALPASLGAALASAMAHWCWARMHTGLLLGNAHQWHFDPEREQASPVPGRLDLMIDLDSWMLLRFTASDAALPARWLPVARCAHWASWPGLRATVYARAVPTAQTVQTVRVTPGPELRG